MRVVADSHADVGDAEVSDTVGEQLHVTHRAVAGVLEADGADPGQGLGLSFGESELDLGRSIRMKADAE